MARTVIRIAEVGRIEPQALRVVVEGGIVQVGHRSHGADAAIGHLAARAVLLIGKSFPGHSSGSMAYSPVPIFQPTGWALSI